MELTAQPLAERVKRGVARVCPVCGSSAAKSVFVNRMAVCAGYDFSAPILLCSDCDCGYAGTALPEDDLDTYYSDLSKYDTLSSIGDISSLDRERAAMGAAFLAPIVGSLGRALDVGCSGGFFLSVLREAGIRQVHGIDPAADAAEVARSLFKVDVTQ